MQVCKFLLWSFQRSTRLKSSVWWQENVLHSWKLTSACYLFNSLSLNSLEHFLWLVYGSYQMNPTNYREALIETSEDEAEGADILLVGTWYGFSSDCMDCPLHEADFLIICAIGETWFTILGYYKAS